MKSPKVPSIIAAVSLIVLVVANLMTRFGGTQGTVRVLLLSPILAVAVVGLFVGAFIAFNRYDRIRRG